MNTVDIDCVANVWKTNIVSYIVYTEMLLIVLSCGEEGSVMTSFIALCVCENITQFNMSNKRGIQIQLLVRFVYHYIHYSVNLVSV